MGPAVLLLCDIVAACGALKRHRTLVLFVHQSAIYRSTKLGKRQAGVSIMPRFLSLLFAYVWLQVPVLVTRLWAFFFVNVKYIFQRPPCCMISAHAMHSPAGRGGRRADIQALG
jgi:hypothetical protein